VFERFTEEARHSIVCAQEEARALYHHYIGTEHILLGLLKEEERIGGDQPLQSLGVSLEAARQQVRRIVGLGEESPAAQIPFTPRAKKVLELALREALTLGTNRVGPEHILLGIARENGGVASRVLLDFDADSLKIRNQVVGRIEPRPPDLSAARPAAFSTRTPIDATWLDGLGRMLGQLGGEIRTELGRDPDLGDLLLVIACARHTVAGEAMADLGIDLDSLWGALERVRQQRSASSHESQDMAQLREILGPELVAEIRRRLGLVEGS